MGKVLCSSCIEEVDSRRIGGVPIGDEDNRLSRMRRAHSLFHRDDGWQGLPTVGHMVRGDLEVLGGDEEKDVVLLPQDLDVGLVAGTDLVNRPLVAEVPGSKRQQQPRS